MPLQLRTAQRKKVRLKIGISAPSGAGKTLSSLLFAYGIIKGEHNDWDDEKIWSKIVVIDSENGSGEIYSNYRVKGTEYNIGLYNVITISAPFTVDKYIEAIELAKKAEMEVCIIDSMTHLWNGVGSLLEKQGNIAQRTGNSYTAWRNITPEFNKFVDELLQVDMHVIATMRAKTEYVQEKGTDGKTTIRKVGMAPVFRDGIEYEFSLFMDIDVDHQAHVTKDRTGVLDDEYFVVTPKEGIKISEWIASGSDTIKKIPDTEIKPAEPGAPKKKVAEQPSTKEEIAEYIEQIDNLCSALTDAGVGRGDIANAIKKHYTVNKRASANYKTIEDINVAKSVLEELETLI